jgi:hypothetical protein
MTATHISDEELFAIYEELKALRHQLTVAKCGRASHDVAVLPSPHSNACAPELSARPIKCLLH